MHFLVFMSTRLGRAIRAAFGLVLIATGTALGGTWASLAVFGLLPLSTAAFNVCPISTLFGGCCRDDTCRLH